MPVLRLVLPILLILCAGGLRAAPDVAALSRVLRIEALAQALHEEGLEHGRGLDADMLEGRGGPHWAAEVARIYAVERIAAAIDLALAEGLDPDQVEACGAFFGSPLGQEILSLELAARLSMRDPAVEEAARTAHGAVKGSADARLSAVSRFVAVNDLVERNVAGTMSASFQFYRGLAQGDMLGLDEGNILARVWSEEDATRDETESWLYAYLLMAYQPLTPEELESYIAFSETPAGQALNAALFEGFDALYQQISYEMGLRLSAAMKASDI